MSEDYDLVAVGLRDDVRTELRRYRDHWLAVRMRAAVGGGWYVRETIEIPHESPIPLIEVITGAFHLARCERPDACGNDCEHRMPVKLAVAVHKAIVSASS